MDYLYGLLDSEDRFQIPKDLKSRFAKLTLSKKKEIRKSISQNQTDVDKVLARNIIDLLSDDSSDGEAETINRIFLSGTTEKSNEKVCRMVEKLDNKSNTENMEKIVFEDSDITHCSIYEENKDGRQLEKINTITDMEQLKVTENIILNSQNIFTQMSSKCKNNSPDKIVDTLSQDLKNLIIESPKGNVTISSKETVDKIEIISSDSQRKSNINIPNLKLETIINKSILTISSANSTPLKKSINNADDICSNDSTEEEVIIVTDTEEESLAEYDNHVSDLNQSVQTNLYSTLNNSRADRIEAFLKDLEQVPQSNTNLEINIKNTSNDDKFVQSEKSNNTTLNESLEIPETSTEMSFDKEVGMGNNLPNKSIEITVHQEDNSSGDVIKNTNQQFIEQESPTLEDDSPLIQTEKGFKKKPTPTPENSSSDSSECEEKISISAKFNIKIKFSPQIIVKQHNVDESTEKSSRNSVEPSEDTSKYSKSSNSSAKDSDNYQANQKLETPKKSTAIEKNSSLKNVSLDDIDKTAKKILTKLYGNTWQTPEIIKKLDKTIHSPVNINTSLVQKSNNTSKNLNNSGRNSPIVDVAERTTDDTVSDFSMFHKNICHDLESTRLKSPIKNIKLPQTERKVKIMKNVERKCQSVKTKIPRRQINKTIHRKLTSSSSDLSDNELNCRQDNSSSSDESHKPRKKKTDKNKLIYMDLSTDMVKIVNETIPHTPKNNSEQNDKLQDILKSCTYDEKKKILATPKNTLTKRKLFTQHFGNEDEIQIYNSPLVQELNVTNDVQLRVPLPAMFAPPLNKPLESVKQGTPIFMKPTPTTPKTTKNKNFKENTPPATPSSLRKLKKVLAKEFLDDEPKKTYGFLQSLDVHIPKSLCHPNALIYREKFRQSKDELSDKLYLLFNEKVFENKLQVSIVWNKKLQNTAGRCCNRKKIDKRSSTVELSEKVLTSADRLRCTLIHELCHAATWIFSGENGHGATWKSWAKKCNKVFPELPTIDVCHAYDIEYKYTYKCTVCSAKSNAHSRSKKVENIRCAYCHGTIEILLNKKNKDGIIVSTPVRGATGFAKFVKEKYKDFKRPNLTHAEVMKILSSEFAVLSVEEKSKF